MIFLDIPGYILKPKSEVLSKFKEWKALIENSTGRKIKCLSTDNGEEYVSTEFQDFLKEKGFTHQQRVPKTPEQNGVSECMNRTLVETVRSMLSGAKLPKRFWGEGLSTAVYLRNRSPARALGGKTPFQFWLGSHSQTPPSMPPGRVW